MNQFTIPLNSAVNTSDDYIIKNLDTQEKDVLNKKNTLAFKNVLSPLYTKTEDKVFSTSGHTIEKTSEMVLTDEKGRTYPIDNSYTIDSTTDISTLWSGELTSALARNGTIYSIWKRENSFSVVISDTDNNIIKTQDFDVDTTDLLYYSVKLATYVPDVTNDNAPSRRTGFLFAVGKTYTDRSSITLGAIYWDSNNITLGVESSTTDYTNGKDMYVLCYPMYAVPEVGHNEHKIAIGFDDTDLRKRYCVTFYTGTGGDITSLGQIWSISSRKVYKGWGCLGSNGLLTGEPLLVDVIGWDSDYHASWSQNGRSSQRLYNKYIYNSEPTYNYLANGLAYSQQINGGSSDAADITANASLSNPSLSSASGATAWGGVTHTRVSSSYSSYGNIIQKAIAVGIELTTYTPLLLSPNYSNIYPESGNVKSEIVAIEDAYYTASNVGGGDFLPIEQVDFSDSWGNVTWSNGTAAITNGCNPFPYKYMIMNRAESKGRYWDYGPGWARTYFRQGLIKSWEGNGWWRSFAEQWPTSIISFGLSSTNNKNSVRIEYLDPITFRNGSSIGNNPDATPGWLHGSVYTGKYYKYHNIRDTESHIWTNFLGADNLGDHVLLGTIPFNVDLVPSLNLKDQYYNLAYQSTSMKGTLLTSASMQNKAGSMVYIQDESWNPATTGCIFSNGLVIIGKKNGTVKLEKLADYMYKTNTLTGNNLFIDSKESFYGQRGFIPYNGEEIITLNSITGEYSSIDDTDTDGNDTYYSGSGYNIDMTDMQNRAVSYVLPALTIAMIVQSSQTDDLTYQMASNKKELTKPLLYNQFTYKDNPVNHYYTHSLDTTDIHYQTGKKMESSTSTDNYTNWFGIATYDNDKADTTWYVTSSVFFFPIGIASLVTGINYLSSTIDMTDNYTVRLYRTQNVTFPVYNPTTEVYKGSTIFTIYGYNYSFDGQSIYYLGSGDDTAQSSFACYALGMQFLANSGTEAYFYSPFEKRLYLFTGSNTLQIADSLSREGSIVDSIYSTCEQILYLLTSDGNVIAKSQNDMCVIENVDTNYHFEGTDSGMILTNGWSYIKYRLYQSDETEWLPIAYQTEYLGKNDNLYKIGGIDVTFFRGQNSTVNGTFTFDIIYDKSPVPDTQEFTISSKDWNDTPLVKKRFVPKNNSAIKAFRFGINSDDYIYIANVDVYIEETSNFTNAPGRNR